MATLRISVASGSPEHVRGSLTLWKPPTYIGFEAPVPKPPDYSTRARVTALCGGRGAVWLRPAMADKTFAALYRDFLLLLTRTLPSASGDGMKKKTCPYCGSTWKPRVDDPVRCPRCMRVLTKPKLIKEAAR